MTINDAIAGLQDLVAMTLQDAFAPAECGCQRSPWSTDPSTIPAEQTPWGIIEEGQPELIESGNGWPEWTLHVTVWVIVKTVTTSAEDTTVRERMNTAIEALMTALIGNPTLGGIAVPVRLSSNPEGVNNATEGAWRIPLTLEIPR